jgi:MerR family redox-sensitive transcriptional activator SoxR
MPARHDYLTIGEAARRSGVATSTLRFYESRGLVRSVRTSGNQRRYHRSMLRRISIIRIAQTLGLTLDEIAAPLATLPDERTPTKQDWERLSTRWRDQLEERIVRLQQLRERLTGCIGCGCLSLRTCSLYNAGDQAAASGAGPRYLLGDAPEVE